jgi:hypothetical protein
MDLLGGYLQFLTNADTPAGLFTEDVILDMNVPSWQFQVQGIDALRGARLAVGGQWDVHPGPLTTTSTGFVVETSYDSTESGVLIYTRSVNIITVTDGHISKIVHYCTGPWGPQTRAQHAREAPMLAG